MPVRNYHLWTDGNWRRGPLSITPGPTPGEPPPPVGGSHRPASTIFGSSAGPPDATDNPNPELDIYRPYSPDNRQGLFDYLQTEFAGLIGFTHSATNPLMKAFHNYDKVIPTSISGSTIKGITSRGLHGVVSAKASFGSVAAGTHDAKIQSFCDSYKHNKTLYWILNHEPSNDGANNGWTAAEAQQWRNDQAHWAKKIIQYRGKKPIVPTTCVINYHISPLRTQVGAHGPVDGSWHNCAPEMLALGVDLDEVVYSVDGYDDSPTAIGGAKKLYNSTANRTRGWGFQRYAVSEGACKSYSTASPNDRGVTDDWIREMAVICDTLGVEFFMWFNSGVGNRATAVGWYIYGETNKKQWANVCAGRYP
jgi:hypothetical protein